MKSAMGFALLAVILLTGTISPAVLAQTPDLAGNVIINEVELNPPGSDSRSTSNASSNVNEFVELYNPTDSAIDVSGWQLIPSKSWKSYTIPSGSIIQSNDHAVFMASSFWFDDIGDFVTLKDSSGVIVDQTPLLEDPADDLSSWQRVYDGLDTDNSSDWVLKTATGLSSNGNYIVEDIEIGITHVKDDRFEDGYIRTPLGGFVNHSDNPNCVKGFKQEEWGKIYHMMTIRPIKKGEELTLKYTFYKV